MVEGRDVNKGEAILKYGMIGGGSGSFIGDVHRKAAQFDGKAKLVSGCFSRDYDNTLRTGRELNIEEDRPYSDYNKMAEKETDLDFVAIVSPNNTHYGIAKAFMEKGVPVICEKPMTCTLGEAEELAAIAGEKDLVSCITYTYSGYPMVKHARGLISRGEIGKIQMVMAEYPQEWLATPIENTGQKQAEWRTDPKQSGISNCVGDIGTHIENTVSYMTGLKIQSLCAKLDTFVKGRPLDDNAQIMLKYENGASGVYWCSQIAIGYDNGLRIRIFGTKGTIEWAQEDPNYLRVSSLDNPTAILSRGRDELYPQAEKFVRIPSGHPEGYYEAFANIYSSFCQALIKKKGGEYLTEDDLDFPKVEDGVDGVRFITRAVESSKKGAVWIKYL